MRLILNINFIVIKPYDKIYVSTQNYMNAT